MSAASQDSPDVSGSKAPSLTDILLRVADSGKDLLIKQGDLVKSEIDHTITTSISDLKNMVLFSALLILAAIPLMAFFILGLGTWLDNNYWLSSLIVAAVWGGGCGGLAWKFYRDFLRTKKDLPLSREAADASIEMVKRKSEEVKDAVVH